MKKMIILICILSVGCFSLRQINEPDIIGEYVWNEVYSVGATMIIKEDFTFEYNWYQGLLSGITFGEWRVEGRQIILNSEFQPSDIENQEITKIGRVDFDGYLVKISDEIVQEVDYAVCFFLKDTLIIEMKIIDENGICHILGDAEIDKIIIGSIDYEDFILDLNTIGANSFEVKLKNKEKPYHYFSSAIWKKNGNDLYDYLSQKGKLKKEYFKKIK